MVAVSRRARILGGVLHLHARTCASVEVFEPAQHVHRDTMSLHI